MHNNQSAYIYIYIMEIKGEILKTLKCVEPHNPERYSGRKIEMIKNINFSKAKFFFFFRVCVLYIYTNVGNGPDRWSADHELVYNIPTIDLSSSQLLFVKKSLTSSWLVTGGEIIPLEETGDGATEQQLLIFAWW